MTLQNANSELLQFAMTMAKRIAVRVRFRQEFKSSMDVADLEQEFLVYVLERIDQFDSGRGNHEAFVNLLIRNCIAKMCRESQRLRSCPPAGAQMESTDQVIQNEDGAFEEMFRSLGIEDKDRRTLGVTRNPIDELDKADAVEQRIRTLPHGYRRIARRLKTSNQQDVAKSMGISKRRMNEAMQVIREHFGTADLFQS